jgi:F-type H+-transporting ATPase subunit alpha
MSNYTTTTQVDLTTSLLSIAKHALSNEFNELLQKSNFSEIGKVINVGDGVASIIGLEQVKSGEMIEFVTANIKGMALNLNIDTVGVVIFGSERLIKEGDIVRRTGRLMGVPTGQALLGRVVDVLGTVIDGQAPFTATNFDRVEVKAPGIIERQSVREPLITG